MPSKLEAKLKQVPPEPGVYFYRDKYKKIIYVGKAANLRHRVRSYWHPSARFKVGDTKTKVMMGEIADVQWQITASEVDALFLESELIKRYKPKYNIDLKDEKSNLYVKITLNETYPTVSLVRRPFDDGAKYFGPYIASFSLRRALRILRKIFPYNTHKILPRRVCLQYHLGLCPGLEESKTPDKEYRANLKKLTMFLKGERKQLIGQLEREMQAAAKIQDFEEAAKLRDQFVSLKSLSRQVVFGDQERFDISRDQALNGLINLLKLKSAPRRIEAFDVSHIQGTNNTASMIVFIDGVPAKSEYRRFELKVAGNNDVAHMREVISRRFSPTNIERWAKPDLVLIDGGKAQLAASRQTLKTLGITLPILALAKRHEDIIIPSGSNYQTKRLDKNAEALKLLQRIRDEAHRFAVSYHSLLRSKKQTQSFLEDVPGIGPATRKKLIKHFGSIKGVRAAGAKELAVVLGPKKAELLKQYL